MARYFDIGETYNLSDIEIFRSVLGEYGDVARPAKYMVVIYATEYLLLNMPFLCDVAELPGRGLNIDETRYYGPVFKTPYQSAYTDINFSFLCRDEMVEKEFFDRWMEYINPKDRYNFEYRDNYSTLIDIFQFSQIESPGGGLRATYKVQLRQAYPTYVNPLPLSWSDDNIHRLQVTFTFTDWVTPSDPAPGNFSLIKNSTIIQNTGDQVLTSWRLLA